MVSSQEKKWYKITKNDILGMSFQALSGTADGFNQAITHHKYGAGNQFWDQSVSWQNKYKDWPNDKSAKFFGSKTFLVALTDGFHLTRFVDRSASIVSVGISFAEIKQYRKQDIWKVVSKKILLSYLTNRTAFVLVYNNL